MNGNFGFPWQESTNGNKRGEFVYAWRHIVDIFKAAGAENVQFVWCPNVDYTGSPWLPFSSFYPGDDYVGYLGMDGYSGGQANWQPFVNVFGWTYDRLVELSDQKLVMICETGCTEAGGNKAQWLRYALASVSERFPDVSAVVYYNRDCTAAGEGDWRIETSDAATMAWRDGLAWPFYEHGVLPDD